MNDIGNWVHISTPVNKIMDGLAKKMAWDHDYRMLEKGEIIREGDDVQEDDGSWSRAVRCIGEPAPDPAYTSHRIYRRLKQT